MFLICKELSIKSYKEPKLVLINLKKLENLHEKQTYSLRIKSYFPFEIKKINS